MAHPLAGADLGTLAAVVGRAGPPSKLLSGLAIAGAAIARAPFSALEKAAIAGSLPSVNALEPPVFILGHWRSGTTHLYNIMCKSGDWAFVPPIATGLPWDLFGLARVFRPLLERALPEHRYIDNIPVAPDSPQEDEIAIANMSALSFYHGIYFPTAFSDFIARGVFLDGCTAREIDAWRNRFEYLLRKLSKYQDGRRLLIKNPVYTARLKMLAETFPEAKFVHIRRNPYDVFVSMRNFYKKLLAEFALQPYAHVDIDATILNVYARMMDLLERDARSLPASRYIELTYEELDADPIGAVRRIYEALDLPGFAAAESKFTAYLASVRTFEKNNFAFSDEAAEKVEKSLGRFLRQWGYDRPGRPGGQAR